jgi:beta-galactosidase
MYMFHGGTTRGFMNGANYNDKNPYEPQISSYDYDAPLDEAGNATPKFIAFREVIMKHLPAGVTLPPIPAAKPVISIPSVIFTEAYGLRSFYQDAVSNKSPLTFEDLNQAYGLVMYKTIINGKKSGILKLNGLRDYAIVYLNGQRVGVLDRRLKQDSLQIQTNDIINDLDILVENLGRINFGPYLLQNKKGLTGTVTFNGIECKSWEMYSLPFDEKVPATVTPRKFATNPSEEENPDHADQPIVRKGTFDLATTGDTYLDMSQWGKGCVWINGHSIGRYWSIGPQQTLYVPAEWLKKGKNAIMVLELLKPQQKELRSIEKPILNKIQQNTK